jgi:hypothetical protein
MENPMLTFATPTVIAGDRSLVALVAHEMAHSWSGNLVTNATWNDFWLNEGFTVYFENRIMENVYGKDYADMLALLGYRDLVDEVKTLGDTSAETHLKLNMEGRNPDDGVSAVAYEKGFFFLKLLEQAVGREKWDVFINSWFNEHAFQSMTTEDFVAYLNKNLIGPNNAQFTNIKLDEWIYGPGIPSNAPKIVSEKFVTSDAELEKFINGTTASQLDTNGWMYQQWVNFIQHLPWDISVEQMKALDEAFHFTTSGNPEILTTWFILSVNRGYTDAYPAIANYLNSVGRRKLVLPIYKALAQTKEGKERALLIYKAARPGYHFVTQNSVDEVLGIVN